MDSLSEMARVLCSEVCLKLTDAFTARHQVVCVKETLINL